MSTRLSLSAVVGNVTLTSFDGRLSIQVGTGNATLSSEQALELANNIILLVNSKVPEVPEVPKTNPIQLEVTYVYGCRPYSVQGLSQNVDCFNTNITSDKWFKGE